MSTTLLTTFVASIRSLGTVVTLASVGVYLHQNGFVVGDSKRALALISQQVAFPLFLFTKIIYCNQDWSSSPCPDVTQSLRDGWFLLIWPIYVVGAGALVGYLVAWYTKTPPHQIRAVMAACAFGNSSGLPITLLTVVHQNFPSTSELGLIDPTIFLSVYLLLYPALQWGYGGWLLAPDETERPTTITTITTTTTTEQPTANDELQRATTTGTSNSSTSQTALDDEDDDDNNSPMMLIPLSNEPTVVTKKMSLTISDTFCHNVLNNKDTDDYFRKHRHGLSSSDEGIYLSEANLQQLAINSEQAEEEQEVQQTCTADLGNGSSRGDSLRRDSFHPEDVTPSDIHPLLPNGPTYPVHDSIEEATGASTVAAQRKDERNTVNFWETVQNISSRTLQPPVVGALAGILVAVTPLRGIFVDLVDRSSSAPLQFVFDGLYSIGLSAVPINMMILGCNLSASFDTLRNLSAGRMSDNLFPLSTMVGIVVGKMILLPIIGFLSCLFLKTFVLEIPEGIDDSFYLVAMIVFLTPTANNVMVMVELSSSAKEGMATVIALQYAVAPIILSVTISIAVAVANAW